MEHGMEAGHGMEHGMEAGHGMEEGEASGGGDEWRAQGLACSQLERERATRACISSVHLERVYGCACERTKRNKSVGASGSKRRGARVGEQP